MEYRTSNVSERCGPACAAVDAAMSLELAAIEVVWGETDEGGDLLAAHAAELWQQGDEGEGEHRADAWHRGQARVTPREIGIGGDHVGEALVEESDIGLDPRQAALGEAPQHGVFELGGLVLDSNVLVAELAPHGDNLGDPRGDGVMAHDVRGMVATYSAMRRASSRSFLAR